MKKFISVLLAVVMLFALTACAKEEVSFAGTYSDGDLTVEIASDGAVVWTEGEETRKGTCEEADGNWFMNLEGSEKAEYLITINEMTDGTTELWLSDSNNSTIFLEKE